MKRVVFTLIFLMFEGMYAMNELTDSQASDIYKQITKMNFLKCDQQINNK